MQEPLITCRLCGEKVPIRQMKFDKGGKDLICLACYEKQHGKSSPEMHKITIIPLKKESKAVEEEKKPEVQRFQYVCSACKFRFVRSIEMGHPKVCPFCGKENTVERCSTKITSRLIK